MSSAIGNQNVSDREFKEAQDEKYKIIMKELHLFIPKDSPAHKEVCFQAVWKACEAKVWKSIAKIQKEIYGLTDSSGQCIFFKYIQEENEDKIKKIIKKNLHHVLSNKQFHLSLHAVAKSGSMSLIDVLKMSGGGEPTEKDSKGRLPLHISVKYLHANLIHKLRVNTDDGFVLTRFSYYSKKYRLRVCPVSLAIIKGSTDCLDTLIAQGNLSLIGMQFEEIGSILHLAVKVKKLNMLQHLLNRHYAQTKMIIDCQDVSGRTPLILAAILNDPLSLALLIKKGADPRCRDRDGNSAMHYAVLNRYGKIVLLLNQYSTELLNGINYANLTPKMCLKNETLEEQDFHRFINNVKNDNNKAKKDPWNYLLHPPENLAFKGGGPKGIAYLGVVRVLEKRNMLKHVKRVAGTSAGAITAMFIALGYDSKGVENILEETPFTDFLDHPLTGEQIQKTIHDNVNIKKLWDAYREVSRMVSDCVAQVSLKPAVKVMVGKALGFLWDCPGLCAGDKFLQWLEELVYQKTNIRNCTFGELKQLIEQGKKNPEGKAYKHLHVFGIRLGERTQIQRFSSEDPEWEELIIADALRLSMSIPGLFKPYSPRFKQKNGEIYTKNVSYVDGGLVFNYPVEAFDQKQYLENGLSEKEKRRYAFNPRTLGFSLFAPPVQKDAVEESIKTLKDLIEGVFTVYRRAQELILKNNQHDEERTIELDHQGIGLTEFSTHPSSGKGKKAIEEAEEKMEAFFLEQEKEVSDFPKASTQGKKAEEPAPNANQNQEKSGSKAASDDSSHEQSFELDPSASLFQSLKFGSNVFFDGLSEFFLTGIALERNRLRLLASTDPRFKLFEYLSDSKLVEANKEFEKWKSFFLQCLQSTVFIDALIKSNNRDYFLFFKEKGNLKLHTKTSQGPTLFHSAVHYYSLDIFNSLLDFPDAFLPIDEKRNTILHHVITHGIRNGYKDFYTALEKKEKFRELINDVNSLQESPIVMAINSEPDEDLITLSFEYYAWKLNKKYIIRKLLNNITADLSVTDPKSGFTLLRLLIDILEDYEALNLFSKWEEKDLIKKMLKNENSFNDSLLFKLGYFSRTLIKKLIINGININHKCSYIPNPYFENQCRPCHVKDNQSKTFLYFLAERDEYDLLKLLCENLKKYYPDSYQDILNEETLLNDDKKKTALMIAAEKDNAKIVELLIEEGADFQKQVDGVTPLECTSEAWVFPGAYEVIKEALQGKIKRNLTSAEKIGALSYCLKHMHLFVVKHLMITKILPFPIRDIKDQNGNGLLLIVLLSKDITWKQKNKLIPLLFNGKFVDDINQVNRSGTTPLNYGIHCTDTLKFLLNQKTVNVNFQNQKGNTALHHAAMNNQLRAVEVLLAHSQIDVNLQNQNGETPLHLAPNPEIVEKLVKKGANLAIRTLGNKGYTPYEYAVISQKQALIPFLKQLKENLKSSPYAKKC